MLGGAEEVAELSLDGVAGESRHDLVSAHADVAMDAPDRHDDLVPTECAKPRERVLVIRVDERSVEIEKCGGRAVAQFEFSPLCRVS